MYCIILDDADKKFNILGMWPTYIAEAAMWAYIATNAADEILLSLFTQHILCQNYLYLTRPPTTASLLLSCINKRTQNVQPYAKIIHRWKHIRHLASSFQVSITYSNAVMHMNTATRRVRWKRDHSEGWVEEIPTLLRIVLPWYPLYSPA